MLYYIRDIETLTEYELFVTKNDNKHENSCLKQNMY